MNTDDFHMYFSETTHDHADIGTIHIYGYDSEDECVNYRSYVTGSRGRIDKCDMDYFRSRLKQPKLNHYSQSRSVMWPFQRGDRYYKKGLHNDRVYDVTLTTQLSLIRPSSYDRIKDILSEREYTALQNLSSVVGKRGVACVSNDKVDNICILNENDTPEKERDFFFHPRKIADDNLVGMIKFFTGRPYDVELIYVHESTPVSGMTKWHHMLKDNLISLFLNKTLNDKGTRVLHSLEMGRYDNSIVHNMNGRMLQDAEDYYSPVEPKHTTKCFYKSIYLMDIGGEINNDLIDIKFFKDMIDIVNRGYS